MGCGCGGSKRTVLTPRTASAPPAPQKVEPRNYDVFDGTGALVASSTSPVLARAEARRTGGTVVLRETTPVPQA